MKTHARGFLVLFILFALSVLFEACSFCRKEFFYNVSIFDYALSSKDKVIDQVETFNAKIKFKTDRVQITKSDFDWSQLSMFSKSYASKCPTFFCYEYKIVAINITSNSDFNMTHPIGALLNDLFSQSDLLEAFPESGSYSGEEEEIVIELTEKPVQDNYHDFYFNVELSNGDKYLDTIEGVTFL